MKSYLVDKVVLSEAEYFVDNDPGEGNANGVHISEEGQSSFVIPTSELSVGNHQLIMRGLNDNQWVTLFSCPFEVKDGLTGMESIVWKLNFSCEKTSAGIKLESNEIPDGSTVTLLTLNGSKLEEKIWSATSLPLYLDFNYSGIVIIHIMTPGKEVSVKLLN